MLGDEPAGEAVHTYVTIIIIQGKNPVSILRFPVDFIYNENFHLNGQIFMIYIQNIAHSFKLFL